MSVKNKKLVDEWKGKLFNYKVKIQIHVIPRSNRRPIITCETTAPSRSFSGPFYGIRELAPIEKKELLKHFKTNKKVYRVGVIYTTKGGYQGSKPTAYKTNSYIFSLKEKDVKDITKMLLKYQPKK